MNLKRVLIALTTGAAFAAWVSIGSLGGISPALADDDDEHALIRRGFEIAPVPLNLAGKDPALVGLGSYLVNVLDHCNTCHSAGPATQWEKGYNPFFKNNGPAAVNPATYMGGGRIFPPLVPVPPGSPPLTPVIVSRNLTPDKTGLPEGGRTFAEFQYIIRTGTDLDQQHPNCADASITASTTCFPQNLPFNGDLLQVMPWPDLRHLTDHELLAIYAYLSAIPCVAGPPAPSPLHNDCGP